jgi:hypothetical protein
LVEKIGFRNSFLRWVPPVLADELRRKRVELAGQLLELVESQRSIGFCGVVTDIHEDTQDLTEDRMALRGNTPVVYEIVVRYEIPTALKHLTPIMSWGYLRMTSAK